MQTPVLMRGRRFSYGACGNGAYTVAIAYVCPSTTLHVYPGPLMRIRAATFHIPTLTER